MATKALSLPEALGELEGHLRWDATSLTVTDPDMTFENWQRLGRLLGHFRRGSDWWIGDWLNFGQEVFGEESAQAVEATRAERFSEAERITGLAPQTLLNISSVCNRVARSRRRTELSFSTHAAVAALEPDEQKEWLSRAVQEEWTVADLRAAIHEAMHPTDDGDGSTASGSGLDAGLTLGERLEAAARLVFHQGQPQRSGDVLVPGEAWQHLVSALGEE